MKRKLLSALDGLLLFLRYPFIARFERTPEWLLRVHLVPLGWTTGVARKIEKLEEMEELC